MKKKIIRVGTLFSGIGAFEQALKQLDIPHKIKFACDNGEIDLIPLDPVLRKEYKRLDRNAKKIEGAERERYNYLKGEINGSIEHIRTYALHNLPQKFLLHSYISKIYSMYGATQENKMRKSYIENYNIDEEDFYTDVRFLNGVFYEGQVDVMVGGSPCQSFSTYGKKRGLDDTRGTLFYDYARIIQEVQPKIFIYENVPGLLAHDDKRTWEIMLEVWNNLGYVVRFDKLNAKHYNHPQNRLRLFLIGFREDIYDENHPYEFPEKMELTHKASEYLEPSPVANKYYLGQKGFEWVTNKEKNKNKTRYNRDIIGCETANQQFNWIGDLRVEEPTQEHYDDPRIYIGELNGKPAVARQMTPRECLRLMGFDDSFKIVVEDKEAWRQAGNSIVVPVLKEIIKSILPYL